VKRFNLICADPDWHYKDRLRQSKTKRGAQDVYTAELPFPELLRLPVPDLADDDAILCLWTTSTHVRLAFTVLDAWQFEYKQMGAWGKVRNCRPKEIAESTREIKAVKPQIGMGRIFRQSAEFYLVATRGRYAASLVERNRSSLILEPRSKHSKKPELLQDNLEAMFPSFDRRIELFARRERADWLCVGNEIDGRDIRDALADLLPPRRRLLREAAE
jgi:N6-adenosine-specific RNA methylase IME4